VFRMFATVSRDILKQVGIPEFVTLYLTRAPPNQLAKSLSDFVVDMLNIDRRVATPLADILMMVAHLANTSSKEEAGAVVLKMLQGSSSLSSAIARACEQLGFESKLLATMLRLTRNSQGIMALAKQLVYEDLVDQQVLEPSPSEQESDGPDTDEDETGVGAADANRDVDQGRKQGTTSAARASRPWRVNQVGPSPVWDESKDGNPQASQGKPAALRPRRRPSAISRLVQLPSELCDVLDTTLEAIEDTVQATSGATNSAGDTSRQSFRDESREAQHALVDKIPEVKSTLKTANALLQVLNAAMAKVKGAKLKAALEKAAQVSNVVSAIATSGGKSDIGTMSVEDAAAHLEKVLKLPTGLVPCVIAAARQDSWELVKALGEFASDAFFNAALLLCRHSWCCHGMWLHFRDRSTSSHVVSGACCGQLTSCALSRSSFRIATSLP